MSSIRRNKAACRLVRAQQSAALALDIPLSQLRRGMVAISPQSNQPIACQYFQVSLGLGQSRASITVMTAGECVRAVPPHGDRGGLPDDCPHRQHSADSRHRGDLPCKGDEEQRPGQRHVQVQTHRTRSSCAIKRLLIVWFADSSKTQSLWKWVRRFCLEKEGRKV